MQIDIKKILTLTLKFLLFKSFQSNHKWLMKISKLVTTKLLDDKITWQQNHVILLAIAQKVTCEISNDETFLLCYRYHLFILQFEGKIFLTEDTKETEIVQMNSIS